MNTVQPIKPAPLPVKSENIPQALRERPQWVCWRYRLDESGSKWTKPPLDVKTGYAARSTDPQTWTDFDTAVDAMDRYDGIGFVLTTEDPFTGIDLDNCIDEQSQIEPWAQEIVEQCWTYTERSPSGKGLRLILQGKLPEGARRKGQIEMYDTARYLTITGQIVDKGSTDIADAQTDLENVYSRYIGQDKPKPHNGQRGQPAQPHSLSDDELLRHMFNSKNGAEIKALCEGSISAYNNDHSAADMALCMHLAFWTGKDPQRMDNLFRRSGPYREKWDQPHYANGDTYGQGTIKKAIENCTEIYRPPAHTFTNETASHTPKHFFQRERETADNRT